MGLLHKLTNRTAGQKNDSARSHSKSLSGDRSSVLPQRSSVTLAGAFLVVPLLAVIGAGVRNGDAHSLNAANESNAKTTKLELNQSTRSTIPSAATSTSPSTSNAAPTSTNLSTTTTTDDSGTSTQVTVNGHPVAVPTNGTTQQTVTSQGQHTTVQVTNNQNNDGSAANHTMTNTNVHVSSTNHSTSLEEDRSTP